MCPVLATRPVSFLLTFRDAIEPLRLRNRPRTRPGPRLGVERVIPHQTSYGHLSHTRIAGFRLVAAFVATPALCGCTAPAESGLIVVGAARVFIVASAATEAARAGGRMAKRSGDHAASAGTRSSVPSVTSQTQDRGRSHGYLPLWRARRIVLRSLSTSASSSSTSDIRRSAVTACSAEPAK